MRIAIVFVALSACAPTQETDWALRFEDETAPDRAVVIEAILLRGGCRGEQIYRAEVPREGSGPRPPALGAGRYGFAGVARDASCRTIARGCAEAELPLGVGARVSVPLEPVDEPSVCAACVEGRCEGAPMDEDAGTFEAADGGVIPPCARGRCYAIEIDRLAWDGAESACIAWGGHLAAIDDAEEEAWILERTGGSAHWIGLADLDEEGRYGWTEGDSSYARWRDGAPHGNPGWRDCVAMTSEGWEDLRCRDPLPYVCERAE